MVNDPKGRTANMPKVAIVACGWFGLPLAKSLLEKGYLVKGSRRGDEGVALLQAAGIQGFRLDLDDNQQREADFPVAHLDNLFDADYLVINIPPRLTKGRSEYLARLERLRDLMQGHSYRRVIFVSTTGVYPSIGKVMTEEDAAAYSEDSETLLAAEALFTGQFNTCVLRFAGLVGPKRHPGRFLAGKTGLGGAVNAVNLVHLDDTIAAVISLIEAPMTGRVYNLCAAHHPGKKEFYTRASLALGLVPPEFNEVLSVDKIIDGERISRELGFVYRHPDLYTLLTAC
jgi:nucleoside-diphosphate-sugar epimerase